MPMDVMGFCIRKRIFLMARLIKEKYIFHPWKYWHKNVRYPVERIGCGFSWTKWFPECSREFAALKGAWIDSFIHTAHCPNLPYPWWDSKDHWPKNHAGPNAADPIWLPVFASNRLVGKGDDSFIQFYGFVFHDERNGAMKCVAGRDWKYYFIISGKYDLEAHYVKSASIFGLFSGDRRPDQYQSNQFGVRVLLGKK